MPIDQTEFDASVDPNSPLYQAAQKAPGYTNLGAYITPEQRKYLRDMAFALQKPGEAKSWAQVLGNMAQTGVGALLARQAYSQDQQAGQGTAKRWDPANYAGADAAQGGGGMPTGGGGGAPAAAPAASGDVSASVTGEAPKSLMSAYSPVLGPAGAAGLTGGFGHETAGTFSPAIQGDNNSSIGLAQWHDTGPGQGRKSNLAAYAKKYGKSPTDPDVQRQYPLVEMGLAGSSSDPGFSTERKAGQALQAARTPQEATAAALMFERPKGWSPAHPENSSGYSQRLAYATALMGGASGGATAYADAGGGQGGGGQQWPAQRPQTQVSLGGGGALPQPNHPSTIGGQPLPQRGPVMAQAPGGSPLSGMGGRQIGELLADPNIDPHLKARLLEGQIPQPTSTPFGGTTFPTPLQNPRDIAGVAQGGVGAGGGTVNANTLTPVSPTTGIGPTQFNLPGGSGGGNGLNAFDPLAAKGRELGAQSESQKNIFGIMLPYASAYPQAKLALKNLDVLEKISEAVANPSLWGKIKQEIKDRSWVDLGGNSPLEAYTAAAKGLVANLPPSVKGYDPDTIGAVGTTEAGRKQINQNLRTAFEYAAKQGEVANDFFATGGTDQGHFKRFNALEPPTPKWTLPQPGAPVAAGAQAAGGAGKSLPAPKTAKEYADIPKGDRYQHPDDPPGHYRTKK